MWKSWKRRDLAENKTDYSKYRFSWQEYLLCFFKAFFATGAFTGMFYRSWLGMLAFPAVWKVLYGRDKKNRIQKRKERLSLQFKDTILMVTAGIQAGSSIENAFLDVEREIGVLYGQNSEMGQELALIRKGLTNRVALEQMLLDFGRRSGIEEIRDFTEVFATARHLGGNLKEMIQRTADLTGQRMETQRDIATMLASRKYEQKVMMLIPFLLYGYMQVSSKGFFDGLYHNPAGIAIMTVCLGLYLASCVLADKLWIFGRDRGHVETEKRKKGWTVSFVCAAAGSVAEKNGTKPRRQENGKQAGTGNFVPDLGAGNRRSQILGISGSKDRAPAGDPVRRAGDGAALSDFFDDRRFRAIDRTASPGQRGRRPDVCTGC